MGDPKENPFRSPSPSNRQGDVSNDPSIENEPHLKSDSFVPDDSEHAADRALAASGPSVTDSVDHSVWDEPGLSTSLAGDVPDDGLTYARWLEQRLASTSVAATWLVTLAIAASSGILAVLGTIFWTLGSGTWAGAVAICLAGPLTEEIMKVALAIWTVEKRPYLFSSAGQILICAAASGLMFAVVENIIYLNVYIPDPEPWVAPWRWTVCVALHSGCALISGCGLAKVWKRTMHERSQPQLRHASKLIITAIVIHAVYNSLALLMSLSEFGF